MRLIKNVLVGQGQVMSDHLERKKKTMEINIPSHKDQQNRKHENNF